MNKAFGLLNDGMCVKKCPGEKVKDEKTGVEKWPKIECSATKRLVKMTKTLNNSQYFDEPSCTYYLDPLKLAEIMPGDIGKLAKDGVAACKKGNAAAKKAAKDAGLCETGMAFRYPTVPDPTGHFCLPYSSKAADKILDPKFIEYLKKAFMASAAGDKVIVYFKDVATTWPLIACSVALAFVVAVIYITLLQFVGGLMIWLSFVLAFLSCAGGGLYAWKYSNDMKAANKIENETVDSMSKMMQKTPEEFATYVMYGAYVCWGLAGVVLITLCCCFSALKLGIAVFNATISFTRSNLTIFFQPLFALIASIIWFAAWGIAVLWLFSCGEPEPREKFEFITEIKWEDKVRYMFFYQVFGFFWMNAFIVGCC